MHRLIVVAAFAALFAPSAQAATPSLFTPEERAAILCSERISVTLDLISTAYEDVAPARQTAMVADANALRTVLKAFDGKHPSYPSTAEGRQRLEAQKQLIAGDAQGAAAYTRFESGDRAPLLALMRRCEVMSGVKALGPTFGTW